jgi:lipopolysaccharide/colanic/teichoic acid biosynthesis glycosyltransferase
MSFRQQTNTDPLWGVVQYLLLSRSHQEASGERNSPVHQEGVILSPVFLTIVLGIKLTSKGPVFFKQHRPGQWGKAFISLKFRTLYVNDDEWSLKEYVTKFITRGNGTSPAEGRKRGEVVYKMTRDRRITPLGNILRKTGLDELPQLINVLKGEISLVGSRRPAGDRHPAPARLAHARPNESSG